MTDKFTLGHYLYNARKLRKTAADPFDFSQWGAVQRSYDPHYRPPRSANDPNDPEFRYKQAIWDKRNNLSPEAHTRAIKDNLYYDADHDLNFNSTAEGNSGIYRNGPDNLHGWGEVLSGFDAPTATTPYEQQNVFGQLREPYKEHGWWAMAPTFQVGNVAGEAIGRKLGYDGYWGQMFSGLIGGGATETAAGIGRRVANKVVPKFMASKFVSVPSALVRGAAKFGPMVNVGLQHGYQWTRPQKQINDEIASKGAYIRSLGKGNSAGAGWRRIGANFANNLDVGVDAAGTVLAFTGHPIWSMMLTNGSASRVARGYMDALSNTGLNAQQRSLQSAAFWDQLKSMGGFDWFGGGKLDEGMLEQRGFERKLNQGYFDGGRLNAFRQSLRASGMSAGEIARKVEETRAAMPLFFNSGINEADRYKSTDRLYLDGASQARADAAKK